MGLVPKPPHVSGLQCPLLLNTLEPCSLMLTVLTNILVSCGVLRRPTGSELQEGSLGIHLPGTAPASRSGIPVGSCKLTLRTVFLPSGS